MIDGEAAAAQEISDLAGGEKPERIMPGFTSIRPFPNGGIYDGLTGCLPNEGLDGLVLIDTIVDHRLFASEPDYGSAVR